MCAVVFGIGPPKIASLVPLLRAPEDFVVSRLGGWLPPLIELKRNHEVDLQTP